MYANSLFMYCDYKHSSCSYLSIAMTSHPAPRICGTARDKAELFRERYTILQQVRPYSITKELSRTSACTYRGPSSSHNHHTGPERLRLLKCNPSVSDRRRYGLTHGISAQGSPNVEIKLNTFCQKALEQFKDIPEGGATVCSVKHDERQLNK